MKTFFKTFFAVIVANIVLAGILFLFIAAFGASIKEGKKPDIHKGTYLVVDIYGEVLEYNPPESFPESIIGEEPETAHRILTNLEKARVDDRIKGVIVKISSVNGLGLGMVEEIRGEIQKLRNAGKPVYAYSDGLDSKSLFLTAACDSVFMPPPASLYYVGFGRTVPYAKGMLQKLGIKADLHKIAEYKSAAELVMRDDMSKEAREMYNWILDDIWEMQMAALTEELGISEEKLVEDMEYAIFTADEAKEAGFID
jgi:protease-4